MFITLHSSKADAMAYIAEQADDSAHHLSALAGDSFESPQEVVADPANHIVWHAQGTLNAADGWAVTPLKFPEAIARFRNMATGAERIWDSVDADASSIRYAEAILDDYRKLVQMALPSHPREAARYIKSQQEAARNDQVRWARAYASVVRDLVGTERGGKAHAARELGISEVQVGRILAEDDARTRY